MESINAKVIPFQTVSAAPGRRRPPAERKDARAEEGWTVTFGFPPDFAAVVGRVGERIGFFAAGAIWIAHLRQHIEAETARRRIRPEMRFDCTSAARAFARRKNQTVKIRRPSLNPAGARLWMSIRPVTERFLHLHGDALCARRRREFLYGVDAGLDSLTSQLELEQGHRTRAR